MDYKKQLIDMAIQVKALSFGSYTLKSGRISPYFFNAGLFNSGLALKILGEAYASTVKAAGLECDMLFGPAYKGIPLVSSMAVAMAAQGRDIPYAYNRKEVKDHGEGGLIIGAPLQGRVLIVDDVISAGTAVNESASLILSQGATLAGILVALDRQERGQGTRSAVQELAERYHVPVISILSLTELITYTESDPALFKAMQAYREQYGV